jgi:hypothetical protein
LTDNMKCTLDCDRIIAYRLGELSGREADDVGRHIAGCPRCSQELAAMDAICRGLSELPRIEPGTERWGELSHALDRERQARETAILGFLARVLRRPAVAAGAFLLLLCALIVHLSTRRESIPAHTDTGIEEMGSKIAHARPGEPGFSNAMDSYISDARTIIAEIPACAASSNAGCWSGLREDILERDMLYRAIYLREQLSSASRAMPGGGMPQRAGADELRTLIDDLSGIFRAISERSPESLTREGGVLENEMKRMDLINRLVKGGSR